MICAQLAAAHEVNSTVFIDKLDVKIKFCNEDVQEVSCCKYLRVYIDNIPSKHHMAPIFNKSRAVIDILSKVRHLIPVYL